MGKEDPLSSCFSLLGGSQLTYRLGQLECECLPLDEAPRFVKEEGAQMPYMDLSLPEIVFPQKQAEGLER